LKQWTLSLTMAIHCLKRVLLSTSVSEAWGWAKCGVAMIGLARAEHKSKI